MEITVLQIYITPVDNNQIVSIGLASLIFYNPQDRSFNMREMIRNTVTVEISCLMMRIRLVGNSMGNFDVHSDEWTNHAIKLNELELEFEFTTGMNFHTFIGREGAHG